MVQLLSSCLPLRSCSAAAQSLADWRWRTSTTTRRAVQANLTLVQQEPVSWDSPSIRETFRHFSSYLVEFFAMHRVTQPVVSIEGREHFIDAHHRGRGAIVLTAHVGNWELGGVLIRRMGLPVAVVALPHADPRLDRLFNAQRRRCGITVIPLTEHAARQSLQHLREGEVVGLLGDQEFAGEGLRVAFGRQWLRVPRGPAVLSLRSGAPVVPAFLIREGYWKFRFFFEPPIWPERTGTHGAAVQLLTQRYTQIIEQYVTRFSTQWMMFQPLMPEGASA